MIAQNPENINQSAVNLQRGKIILLVILGAIFWFFAALLTRLLVPLPFYQGWGIVAVYALTIPGTVPFVFIVSKIAGLYRGQIATGYTIATTSALLLDGCALAFTPALYANNSSDALQAAAAILWGAGVGQVLAFIIHRPKAPFGLHRPDLHFLK
jgi:hypothetical protein